MIQMPARTRHPNLEMYQNLKRAPVKAKTRSSCTNVASTSKTVTTKRRKGELELSPSMNMVILCGVTVLVVLPSSHAHVAHMNYNAQILSFLRPMDLLNLSRITKAFRSLLVRLSSAFIWRVVSPSQTI
ncbi:hypothetical protein F4604DRAFT_1720261 [Suillus subluteus]|nr:hypothetical protein F4604DRAFT_1720261 [Suillus subluteus]